MKLFNKILHSILDHLDFLTTCNVLQKVEKEIEGLKYLTVCNETNLRDGLDDTLRIIQFRHFINSFDFSKKVKLFIL